MKKSNWCCGVGYGDPVDITDKKDGVWYYISYMLNRTQSMFKYTGLPDSLPQRELEIMLQTKGWIAIPIPSKVPDMNGNIYAFAEGAALGGVQDVYYRPTVCTISSPYLDYTGTLRIGEDCIIIPSDSMYMGLLPLFARYATQLVENEITIRLIDINTRIVNLLSAPDDRTLESAKSYLEDIANGKLGVVAENAFLDGIRSQPYASTSGNSALTQAIELQQYLKAGWFNDIGLNANYNMKRESINSGEAQLNDDALLPLALDMLRMRQIGFDALNKACGTNIHVELNAAWRVRQEEQEQTLETIDQMPEEETEEARDATID